MKMLLSLSRGMSVSWSDWTQKMCSETYIWVMKSCICGSCMNCIMQQFGEHCLAGQSEHDCPLKWVKLLPLSPWNLYFRTSNTQTPIASLAQDPLSGCRNMLCKITSNSRYRGRSGASGMPASGFGLCRSSAVVPQQGPFFHNRSNKDIAMMAEQQVCDRITHLCPSITKFKLPRQRDAEFQ